MTRRPRLPYAPLKRNTPVPPDLRAKLEVARLDLRALFRALDELHLAQDLPLKLQELFALDADFAEALYVLDLPPTGFDLAAMTRDTLASLQALPSAITDMTDQLSPQDRARVVTHAANLRPGLSPNEAYRYIPGRDPHAG